MQIRIVFLHDGEGVGETHRRADLQSLRRLVNALQLRHIADVNHARQCAILLGDPQAYIGAAS